MRAQDGWAEREQALVKVLKGIMPEWDLARRQAYAGQFVWCTAQGVILADAHYYSERIALPDVEIYGMDDHEKGRFNAAYQMLFA